MVRGKSLTILQANLNHARRAQYLFLQTMAERGCGLGVVAEPYAVPPTTRPGFRAGACGGPRRWLPSCGGGDEKSPPCGMEASGRYFVTVRWGTICVVGVYAPPSLGLA